MFMLLDLLVSQQSPSFFRPYSCQFGDFGISHSQSFIHSPVNIVVVIEKGRKKYFNQSLISASPFHIHKKSCAVKREYKAGILYK